MDLNICGTLSLSSSLFLVTLPLPTFFQLCNNGTGYVFLQLVESREQEERLANLRKYCQNILTSLSDDVEWIQEYRLTRSEAYITPKNMNKEERKPFSRR